MELSPQDNSGPGFLEVLRVSWPASLTMLNTTVIKFVDGLMVSRVGPGPFSAQFLAGMSAFIPEALVIGILTVVNTYVAQNFGARRYRRTGQYAWAGMMVAQAAALLILPLALLGGWMFGALGHEEHLLEAMYFRYMIVSVLVTLPTRVLEQFFFGIGRPGVVLAASVVANGLNVAINYVLIFGKLGLPAMGLQGAAIGSLTAWTLQFVMLLAVFLSRAVARKYGTRLVRAVRRRHCLEVLGLGWPAGVQLCNDMLSWSICVAVLAGMFGQAHRAATTAVMRYLGLAFMPAVGIGIATTALVGRYIGAGRPDLAKRRTHQALLAGLGWMGLCGLAFWIFRYPMVAFFVRVVPSSDLTSEQAARLAGEILRVGGQIMLCAAVFQLFDAVGIVYIGALRGSGDTRWPMFVTLALSWTVILGGGLAMVLFVPQLTSVGPWIAASAYVIIMGLVMTWRFESGAWRKIDLLGRARRVRPTPVSGVAVGIPDVAPTEQPPPDRRGRG